MAVPKRGVIVLAAVGAALGFGLVGVGIASVIVREAAAAEARTAFEDARQQLETAAANRDAAIADARASLQTARDARTASIALLAAAEPALLADAGTRDALQLALDELTTTAALRVNTNGSVLLPALPAPSSIPPLEQPSGHEAQLEAAQQLVDLADALSDDAETLQGHVTAIESALGDLRSAALAVTSSAHEKGAATPAPELASPETVDAYTAAVAALAHPPEGADLAALVKAYRDSWNAAVASNEEAVRARDRDAIEPTYINGILVVNKTYALPSWYGDGLTGETLAAFDAMRSEAASLGLDLYISSGFRSYWSQESIYNRYVATDGQAAADRYSARPGHSEHQSGLTFDLNTIDEAFGSTAEGVWVRDNAHRFGFVVRYPPGKEAITGYIWEPWHLRYLGVPVATELYSSGLTLEEYLGVTSQYR